MGRLIATQAGGDHGGRIRLHSHRCDRLAFGVLDIARYPGDGAPSAHTGHQNINLAVGGVPDFRPGGLFMNGRVGRVLELLQHQVGFRILFHQLRRPGNRPGHAFRPRRQYQFCTQCLENLASLQAHGIRHGQHQIIATGGGHIGQRNAGVTAGGLHQGHARLELAALLRIPDHGSTDPALHTPRRVTGFQFGENIALADTVDLYQRRHANGFAVVLVNLCHGLPPCCQGESGQDLSESRSPLPCFLSFRLQRWRA